MKKTTAYSLLLYALSSCYFVNIPLKAEQVKAQEVRAEEEQPEEFDIEDLDGITLEDIERFQKQDPIIYKDPTWYDEEKDKVLAILAEIPGLIWFAARIVEACESIKQDKHDKKTL
jgi:hypothetical protein